MTDKSLSQAGFALERSNPPADPSQCLFAADMLPGQKTNDVLKVLSYEVKCTVCKARDLELILILYISVQYAAYVGVHCIMYIGNMWKLLFGSEDVYIF